MITIWLRELSSHNNGFGIDKQFDLDGYTSAEDVLEELFEYTREVLEENGEDLSDYNLEEYMITDWEVEEDFDLGISEYSNIGNLIQLNNTLEEMEDYEKVSLIALLEKGYKFTDAVDNVGNTTQYGVDSEYSGMEEVVWSYIEEGVYGDIPDNITNYLNISQMASDLEINGTWCGVSYNGNTYMVDIHQG